MPEKCPMVKTYHLAISHRSWVAKKVRRDSETEGSGCPAVDDFTPAERTKAVEDCSSLVKEALSITMKSAQCKLVCLTSHYPSLEASNTRTQPRIL